MENNNQELVRSIAHKANEIYTDGGVISKNPSLIGGTWAFCLVNCNENFERTQIIGMSGFVPVVNNPFTNNWSESIAICLAFESLPEKWSGTIFSDSACALGRAFLNWRINNLPKIIHIRTLAALERLGEIKYRLVQGHPNKKELNHEFGTDEEYKLPLGRKETNPYHEEVFGGKRVVSIHNVWCDKECKKESDKKVQVNVQENEI